MSKKNKNIKRVVANKVKPKRKTYNVSTLKQNIMEMTYYLDAREFLNDEEIKKIEEDATVISSCMIRKSATLKKELLVKCESKEVKEAFEKRLCFSFREQALDTHLQGISIFELVWHKEEGYWYPTPKERDYREFELSHTQPLKHILTQAFVPEHKAVVGRYSPKFNRLHGKSLYNALFWLGKFKNASVEFWIEYMQRFSAPWIVGTTEGDKDEMAENLYAMLGGDVAVVEDEDKIELITPRIKGDFKELSNYADDQIREIILGGNLLGEVKGASLAASQTHKEVLEGIAMMDEHILQTLINDIIEQFKKVNSFTGELTATIKDKDAENAERAKRDLDIFHFSGGKYVATKEYIEKTYSIELEEVENPSPPKGALETAPYKFSATPKEDFLASQAIESTKSKAIEEAILKQIEESFAKANSYEEAFEILEAIFEELETKELEEVLAHYIANADILGKAEVESENPNG